MPDDHAARPAEADPAEDMPLPQDPKTIYLGGLFLIAALWAMYAAKAVVLPIVVALVLKLLLQPLVRQLERIRVPRALGAALSILLLLGVIAGLGTVLSSPAGDMIRNFPQTVVDLRGKVAPLREFADRAQDTMKRLGINGDPSDATDKLKASAGAIAGSVASGAGSFASDLLETLLVLFYLLVFGETIMRRLVEVLPHFRDKKQAVEISDKVERDISAYLLTISVINAAVGCACAAVMWGFGVPGPLLWGVVAFCFNFVPILGPLCGVLLFAVIGLATLGASWYSLLPAACYLAIHFAEGEFFTPMVLARRFTLNPIAVMVALLFWFWMWGVAGAILSVPLLAITKLVCDRIRPFRAVGHLLEG